MLENINIKKIEEAHIALAKDLIHKKKLKKLLINGCVPISIAAKLKSYFPRLKIMILMDALFTTLGVIDILHKNKAIPCQFIAYSKIWNVSKNYIGYGIKHPSMIMCAR